MPEMCACMQHSWAISSGCSAARCNANSHVSAQPVNGVLKVGNLTKSDFPAKSPMHKQDVDQLQQRFDDNDMYVLVTTVDHPNGLLRGQVKRKNETGAP